MSQRIKYWEVEGPTFKAMFAVEQAIKASAAEAGVPAGLLHMLKLRASQMNGCAYCVDMHWKDAAAAGESVERLYMLSAWRESALYTPAERAALEWCESLTAIGESHAPDAAYAALREQYSERAVAVITWAVAAINAWNRVAISMRSEPGFYKPAKH